ncbi:MAG: hypothetical protein RLZZ245_1524 [Verrucomicrobiota bacterium]
MKIQSFVGLATAATAAAASATRGSKIIRRRHTPKLNGCSNILADLFLQGLQLTLRRHEITCNFIFKQGIPRILKITDFRSTQLNPSMLLVMKLFTTLVDALVLQAGGIVAQKALNLRLKLEK